MPETTSSLVHSYPTELELESIQKMFNSVTIGSILDVRESTIDILSTFKVINGVNRPVRPSISHVIVLAATAAQACAFNAFTQPITADITRLSFGSVKDSFNLLIERGAFVLGEIKAAPIPNDTDHIQRKRSRIYYPTPLGESLLHLFTDHF